MIPVSIQPEPLNFASIVYNPGHQFLLTTPNPSDSEWRNKSFWREVIPYAANAYGQICAYCATKIHYSTGAATIDHFIPKDVAPHLAYTWSNYRYASSRFNSRKGVKSIADPFTIQGRWFEIKFPEVIIEVNNSLSNDEKILAEYTLKELQLNTDDKLVDERFAFYLSFMDNQMSFAYLESLAPFLASEIKRQNLTPPAISLSQKFGLSPILIGP